MSSISSSRISNHFDYVFTDGNDEFIEIDNQNNSFHFNPPTLLTYDTFLKQEVYKLAEHDQTKIRTLSKNLEYTNLVISVAQVAMTIISVVGLIFDKLSDIKLKIGLGIVIGSFSILSRYLQTKKEAIIRPINDSYKTQHDEFQRQSERYSLFIQELAKEHLNMKLKK
jgi:hypothetical protein